MPMPRKPVPQRHCQYCAAPLERKNYNGRLEERANYMRRKYCDQRCFGNSLRKEHPTLAALQKRASRLRGAECQACGATTNLAAHHVDGNPANNALPNLMTLCGSCHTRWHWGHGKKSLKRQSVCMFCGQPARRLDMCQKHYQRFKRYGSPFLTKKKHGLHGFVLVEELPGPPAPVNPNSPTNP